MDNTQQSSKPRAVLPHTPWSAPGFWRPTWVSIPVLVAALMLFGLGESLIIRSQLGSSPWTVLSLGIANHVPLSVGAVTFCISVVVFLLWLPLKLRAGLGTVFNIIFIALALDVFLPVLPVPSSLLGQLAYCVLGVMLAGIASGVYLTCQMGAGPRDGLMVGLCERTGLRVGVVRTGLEATACFCGWCLGGVVGIGTLIFAFGVGYAIEAALWAIRRWCRVG